MDYASTCSSSSVSSGSTKDFITRSMPSELAKKRNDVSLLIVGESFWNTLDEKKISTKLKSAVFGTLKKLS